MSNLAATLERTREVTTELRRERKAIKQAKPQIYIYKNNPDGSAGLIHHGRLNIRECTKYEFPQKDNVSSTGWFETRASHYIARFIQTIPNNPEECKNVVIRVDMYGGRWRWSGLMHHWDVETRDGVDYLTATFNDDLQFLQFMLGPPNPALPLPLIQWPRDFFLFGPSVWCISTFILCQIIRLEGHPWTLPDDPFDLAQWFDIINWGDWQVHIRAKPFLTDTSLWTVIASRMNTVDSVIADSLEDGQLSIVYRRIFTDEGEQTTGLLDNNVANGALVFEVVDRSGFTLADGTFFGGTVFAGFGRSILQWTDGLVQDTLVMFDDNESLYPDEYWQTSWLASLAQAPAHTLRDSHMMDLKSKVTHSPATAVSVVVGGDNPTANAVAQLIIQATGNLIGYFLLGGFDSLGDIAADIIMPFLVGTILAWLEWKNFTRATNLGWVHLHEIYQGGAEHNAWSLSGLAAWRGGFKATDSETAHTMVVGNQTWFIPGLHGEIGTRMSSTSGALRRNAGVHFLFVSQIKEMTLRGTESGAHEFLMAIGQNKAAMSTGERTARMFKKALDKLHDIGFRIVS